MALEDQSLSDEALARQAQAGCASSFEALVERYEARIFRFAQNSCRNEADAQELTQDTFVSAWLNLRQFDPGRPFATWLFVIARRKCIDRSRARRRETAGELPEPAGVGDPSGALAQRETVLDIWDQARRVLPGLQFQALWLRYTEEMSVADIARVLRRTRVHVKVLLFRARHSLAAKLRERAEPPAVGARPTASEFPFGGGERPASAKVIKATSIAGV